MPEITFRSPGYYDREIDLSAPKAGGPSGVPAGIIGTAKKGPAFVPVTVADFNEFKIVFGGTSPTRLGPYAAKEWLKYRSALTYMRVLGAGANTTAAQIDSSAITGRTTSAGFKIIGTVATHDALGRHVGAVQFLAGRHVKQSNEQVGYPVFTENSSFPGISIVNLIRGVVFLPSTARLMILDGNETTAGKFVASGPDDVGAVVSGKVKLVISSTLGATFSTNDQIAGIKVMTASFDPTSSDYFGKILNTDPTKFVEEQHYLYADFAVDAELATVSSVAVLSGSGEVSTDSGEPATVFRNAFGAFDTRFKTPKSPWFISQPFGSVEYDLFRFEALDDGAYASNLYKLSISNLKMSEDEADPYGSFTITVRDFSDTDLSPVILEQYHNCNLNPTSENYVALRVGDRKLYFNFDATMESERRLIADGKYPNNSKFIRIIMNDSIDRGLLPAKALPFGFRGLELLKTNDALTDVPGSLVRLSGKLGTSVESTLSGSILPPIPFRFKITRGQTESTPTNIGQSSKSELVNSLYHWGVKFERVTDPLNANISSEKNELLASMTKFLGIRELDTLVTSSGADTLCNNKFTLSRVALPNGALSHITSSLSVHMKDACYLRNAVLDKTQYLITDPSSSVSRVTFATMINDTSPILFNRFQQYMKFTTFLAGGFDGLNILDRSNYIMDDKSVSFDVAGGAESSYIPSGFASNQNGVEQANANVVAYRAAIDIMTDPMTISHNILAIPGIDDSYVTDYASKKVKDYGLAMYVMDIPGYSDATSRLYLTDTTRPSVDKTAQTFAGRSIDNNYTATYWPTVFIDDSDNKRKVKVPSSVAAMGALAFNDKIAYPWFAPAGFNRAALDFVSNVSVRVSLSDRDTLQDQRINPIATFPRLGYVIYGQKTLQISKSSLDRVNVRRMLLEVKRLVIAEAYSLCFESNDAETRSRFVANTSLKLAMIQANSGIEKFRVICNETNNSVDDVDALRMNAKVVVVPTRTAEHVAIDFIITSSGVSFS